MYYGVDSTEDKDHMLYYLKRVWESQRSCVAVSQERWSEPTIGINLYYSINLKLHVRKGDRTIFARVGHEGLDFPDLKGT